MFISRRRIHSRMQAGFTVLEVLIASSLAVVVGAALATLTLFSSRTFVYIGDYTDMNQSSQFAMDEMSKLIRQAKQLTSYSTNSLTFLDDSGNTLQFTYDSSARTLTQVSGGHSLQLLANCDSLQFSIYQHTVVPNSFDCFGVSAVTNTRVIQVNWTCSHTVLGRKATTETDESAEIVMRNH